jgi:hypothetical protein
MWTRKLTAASLKKGSLSFRGRSGTRRYRDAPNETLDGVPILTNNVNLVVRKAVAVLLLFAVQGAAVGAPLVHAHPDDRVTQHHHGRLVHTHWANHSHRIGSPDVPALTVNDHDRTFFLNFFVGVGVSLLSVHGIVHRFFELPLPADLATHRPVKVVHTHDPPCFGSLSSRAPPSSLS